MTAALAEAVRRQREASDPGVSVWVSANAGTGKTKVLTDRLLRLLLSGVPPESVVAITFTRAAAAEMENRLFAELAGWAAEADAAVTRRIADLTGEAPPNPAAAAAAARRLLVQVLECPGGIRIQTIHAFCQSLLASFPLEAGLAPHFRALDDLEAAALRLEARAGMLQAAERDGGASAQAFRTVVGTCGDPQIGSVLNEFTTRHTSFPDIVRAHGGIDAYVRRIAELLEVDPADTEADVLRSAWRRLAAGQADGPGRRALDDLEQAASRHPSLHAPAEVLRTWIEAPDDPVARREGWRRWCGIFLTQKGTARKRLPWRAGSTSVPELGGDTRAFLEAESHALQRDGDRLQAVRTFRLSAAFARLAEAEQRRYERLKRARVAVDYDDLLVRTGDLLTRQSASDWILYKLDGGLRHILVDEAQDTAPSQWRVVAAVVEDFFTGLSAVRDTPRTLFAVGDPKQSIYRFQGADPDGFATKRRQFEERARNAARPWKSIQLDLSFRSAPAVLRVVDAVWNQPRKGLRPGEETRHAAFREGRHGRVEVWPPVVPEDGEDRPYAHVRRLARLMAERIGVLVGGDGGRAAQYGPGDIMVLMRQRAPLMPFIVRALREAGIPVAGVDRMRLVEQPPVIDLIELMRFLLHPHDDLALANVLEGPLAGLDRGLGEKRLFDLAHDRGPRSLWHALRDRADDHADYRTVRDRLRALLAKAAHESPFDLFSHVLDGARGARPALLARLGPDAADAIEEFLFQAREFGRRQTPTLEHFADWIEGETIEIKRDLETAAGSVRIMTVHAAKGLEAPVVFLAEREGPRRARASVVWGPRDVAFFRLPEGERPPVVHRLHEAFAEEEQREYERLLYVAMTRARDRVVVVSWQKRAPKQPGPWWSHLVRSALVESPEITATVDRSFPAVGPPPAPHRPSRAYVFEEGRPDAPPEASPAPSGAAPLPDAPGWLRAVAAPEPAVRPGRTAAQRVADAGKATALARGTLAHELLEHLGALDASARRERAPALADRLAPGLPAGMRRELCAIVLDVLDRPEFAFLFGRNSRAEVRIAGDLDGELVEGQIDRLVVTDTEVTVIDFKTGRAPSSWGDAPAGYRKQVGDYARLLAKTYPGRPVRGMLFYIEEPVLLADPEGTA